MVRGWAWVREAWVKHQLVPVCSKPSIPTLSWFLIVHEEVDIDFVLNYEILDIITKAIPNSQA